MWEFKKSCSWYNIFHYMTRRAVENFIARGVVSDEFRNKLLSGQMTRKDIALINPNLDSRDVNAIIFSMMFTDSLENFATGLGEYIDFRYHDGRPAGDNLPVSV